MSIGCSVLFCLTKFWLETIMNGESAKLVRLAGYPTSVNAIYGSRCAKGNMGYL